MTQQLPILRGSIEIEGIRGHFDEDSFVLQISTREKYVEAFIVTDVDGDDDTQLTLYAGERTRRNGEPINDPTGTVIRLPSGFTIEATSGRYTTTILGVRSKAMEDIVFFFEEDS